MGKVNVGDYTFKTQKDFKEYVSELISSIGISESVKHRDNTKYIEMMNVLRRHPRANIKLANMIDIDIQQNALNKNAYEILIIRTDGTREDISWRLCISGKDKCSRQLLRSALRSSIIDQILDYKHNQETVMSKCYSCTKQIESCHIDHENHFHKLASTFIDDIVKSELKLPTSFDNLQDGTNRKTFKTCDYKFMNAWQAHHKERAVLRVLCPTCNLTRSKT